jgi:hypothetical protein
LDVNITPTNYSLGYRVQLRFRISQHNRDLDLFNLIKSYFNSGSIYKYPDKPAISLTIVNTTDILTKIIPFFDENPLLATKLLDYQD